MPNTTSRGSGSDSGNEYLVIDDDGRSPGISLGLNQIQQMLGNDPSFGRFAQMHKYPDQRQAISNFCLEYYDDNSSKEANSCKVPSKVPSKCLVESSI